MKTSRPRVLRERGWSLQPRRWSQSEEDVMSEPVRIGRRALLQGAIGLAGVQET